MMAYKSISPSLSGLWFPSKRRFYEAIGHWKVFIKMAFHSTLFTVISGLWPDSGKAPIPCYLCWKCREEPWFPPVFKCCSVADPRPTSSRAHKEVKSFLSQEDVWFPIWRLKQFNHEILLYCRWAERWVQISLVLAHTQPLGEKVAQQDLFSSRQVMLAPFT